MLSAVNTELVDCQTGAGVKGHELLRPAIMSFGGFPLFMRRRAEEASANFALDLLLGKLLRLDVTARPAVPQIVALGLRNPWRVSFDRATGDRYIAETLVIAIAFAQRRSRFNRRATRSPIVARCATCRRTTRHKVPRTRLPRAGAASR